MNLENIIGIVVLAFVIGVTIMEFRSKKKEDLFTNIIISVICIGLSIYMLVSTFQGLAVKSLGNLFKILTTWIYLLVFAGGATFTVAFLTNYFKYKDLTDEEEEKVEGDEEDAVLTDAEIEEILEKENNEVENGPVSESEKETVEAVIELESLTSSKPKVIDLSNEVVEKEGTSQVPVNQRNPFEKK